MMKRLIIWVLVVVGLSAAVWGIVMASKGTKVATLPPTEPAPTDWQQGPADAKTTIIEYSDLQCPACATYYPVVKEFLAKNTNKVRFVYRHFPLKQIHQNALVAARWAEAAGKQNKFWEFHDIMFENQSAWAPEKDPTGKFVEYATTLGLAIDQLKTDAISQAAKDSVESQFQTGVKAGVNSTPTFFLNGQKVDGFSNLDEFTKKLQAAVDAAG